MERKASQNVDHGTLESRSGRREGDAMASIQSQRDGPQNTSCKIHFWALVAPDFGHSSCQPKRFFLAGNWARIRAQKMGPKMVPRSCSLLKFQVGVPIFRVQFRYHVFGRFANLFSTDRCPVFGPGDEVDAYLDGEGFNPEMNLDETPIKLIAGQVRGSVVPDRS